MQFQVNHLHDFDWIACINVTVLLKAAQPLATGAGIQRAIAGLHRQNGHASSARHQEEADSPNSVLISTN